MRIVVTADVRPLRRATGVTAWAVLEELVLDGDVDEHGELSASTNVRRLAAQVGVSKDTAARALRRLVHAGIVRREVADRGAGGTLPTSSYVVDLTSVDGIIVDEVGPVGAAATVVEPTSAEPRRVMRTPRRVDDAQTSLFDLPASVS